MQHIEPSGHPRRGSKVIKSPSIAEHHGSRVTTAMTHSPRLGSGKPGPRFLILRQILAALERLRQHLAWTPPGPMYGKAAW